MIKKAFRNIISISRWSLIALSIFPISSAKADSNPIITEITDFWFSYSEPTQFLARTYQSDTFPSDPQLWLYNSDTNQLLVTNDDYYGLQSNIEINLEAGNYRLRAGTCCYEPDVWRKWDNTWNIQYELSFNGNPVNTTTTIPETTTTIPETTTTIPETTTTTTTEVIVSTSTEAPTTTTPTIPPTTTLPEEPTWPPTTESIPPTTTSTTIAPTTSAPATLPPTETTSTTVADTVVPSTTPTSSSSVTIVEPPQSSLAPTTTLSPSSPTPLTTLPETTTIPESTDPPTTTVPETDLVIPDSPTSEEINQLADELVASITELSDEEITNLVESIDVSELTEESISAVFSEEVLNELSDDQVTELIDAIVPSELSDDQALALSEALTDAPDSVKQEFEQEIDVFGGQFDTYVSTGSTVPVGARRVIVAAAVSAFAMPAPSSSSRRNR